MVLHSADLHTKDARTVNTAKQCETPALEEEALYQAQAVGSGFLEDTWRIEPSQLKFRTWPDGVPCILGRGRFSLVSFR